MNLSFRIEDVKKRAMRTQCFGMALLLLGSLSGFAAQQTNAFARPDFSAFKIVNERNIFNSKRSRDSREPTETRTIARRSSRVQSFALVGTMENGSGPLAFFEGSSSEFRKVLKPEDNIAGFKVVAVQPSFVKLASTTNEMELRIGMQLVREEEGPWRISARPESLEPSAYTASSSRSRDSDSRRSNESDSRRRSDFQQGPSGDSGFPPNIGDIISSFSVPGGFPDAGNDQQNPPRVNNPPTSSGSGNPEDVLARLRRQREQQNP